MIALALCRFAHLSAAMLVFGASLFLRLDAPDGLRRALAPRLKPLVVAASLIALASAGLWLALEAAAMADGWGAALDPGALAAVLVDTAFGRAWALHLALAAALVVVAVRAPRDDWTAVATLSGLVLASLGLVGHAAMQTGAEGLLHRLTHAAHALAAGAWIGGLVPFVMSLDAAGGSGLRRDAVAAMTRFSVSGHLVVAALVATGMANVALTSGPALAPTTPYRALLDLKIVLAAIMVGLALMNRYVLVPRLRARANAAATLRRNSLVNVGLGALVVALVSVFALFDPA